MLGRCKNQVESTCLNAPFGRNANSGLRISREGGPPATRLSGAGSRLRTRFPPTVRDFGSEQDSPFPLQSSSAPLNEKKKFFRPGLVLMNDGCPAREFFAEDVRAVVIVPPCSCKWIRTRMLFFFPDPFRGKGWIIESAVEAGIEDSLPVGIHGRRRYVWRPI